MEIFKVAPATGAILGLLIMAPLASSAVTGTLRLTSDPGDVIVSLTSIDWTSSGAAGAPNGRFRVGMGTTLTYDAANTPLTVGSAGTILDLVSGVTFPLANFMVFDAAPGLRFSLGPSTLPSIGPGPSNTVCAAVMDPNAPACAVAAGSPFILQPSATGTSVSLSLRGVASDNTSATAAYMAAFTSQIVGRTPAQIQTNILGGGTERSTYSAEFNFGLTPDLQDVSVPEPGTLALLALGGGFIAFALRRKAIR